jgi:hypothetical protein
MSDTSVATQIAAVTRYRADATLQGLMVGATGPEWNIFEQGGSDPTKPVFPRVMVEPITTQLGTLFAMGMDAMDVYLLVSVYTQTEGFWQADAIANRLYNLTHGPIAGQFTLVGGGTNVLCLFKNRQKLEQVQATLIQHVADRYLLMNQG